MKFGKTLQENIFPDWRFYYVDYDGLKRLLKERTEYQDYFKQKDEATFIEALEREFSKVLDFKDVKAGELIRHVQYCENKFEKLDKDDENSLKELEDEISRITIEVQALSSFNRLNHTAFQKILKKHDKHTQFMLKPTFMVRLESRPLQLDNFDNLIVRLSKLYDRIHRRTESPTEKNYETTQVFVRKTSKYWVHADNVTALKCMILKHLPVLVFPNKKKSLDLAVSSVYFDNEKLELYQERLEKSEGALAMRMRWYGSDEPREVFVERKVHKEDWTGEVSVKSRFPIKEQFLNDFLTGEMEAEEILKRQGKMEDLELAKEIQKTILDRKLKPLMRTFYNRIAFQLPDDARVRISLDTELSMIREDGVLRSGSNWKRDDIRPRDYPFPELSESEKCLFPHAILEIKLQTQAGQEPPKWVQDLLPLIEEVPKFSKFLHGTAVLFNNKVNKLPYWLPQMDVDIRKNAVVEEEEEESESEPETPKDHTIINLENVDDEEDEQVSLLTGKKPSLFQRIFSLRRHQNIPQEKQIQVPVRVEPKVFFANERTFLSWIHFSIFLGGISSALVGLGNQKAKISGLLFAFVSVLFTIYALYLYHWRAIRIRNRDPGPYDDRIGPTVVVVIFLAALIVNIFFSIL